MRTQHAQRGQVLPLIALAVVVVGGGAVLLGRIGEAAVSRAAARTAADAAALAGAADGEQAARQVAAANGGTVLQFEVLGQDTRVTVRVGEARAVGRARRDR
ncbi:MAG: pilus assembly protein TadG-related protein [Acidimicrobiales bacterium]